MKQARIADITNNLDNKRIPLNSSQRAEKERKKLYPYIGANNIMGYIDEYIFDEKIICIAEDGGSWGALEDCAKIYNQKVWVNNHAHVLTAKDNLHLEYLCYYLNYTDLNPYITGATRGKLTQKFLNNIKIPLPPLATQKKIAAILDAADAHRQKTKQLLAKYDELAQSIFLEMFGPNHDMSRKWELKEIKDIISNEKGSMRTGPFGSDLLHSEFVEEGIPVLGIDNAVNNKFEWKQKRYITEQKYQKLKRYKVKPKDVIITIMGTVGRTAVVPNDIGLAINTKHLAALTLNHKLANPMFISYSFHSDPFILNQIRKNGKGAIMNGLNLGIIKNTKIKLPPITLQNKFENILSTIVTQRNQVEIGLEKSENLFNSLLQKAFKGELVK